jgi:hypothetical protein
MRSFWRYTDILLQKPKNELDKFVEMIYNYSLSVDKDTFRKYASLDAQEIQKFRLATGC